MVLLRINTDLIETSQRKRSYGRSKDRWDESVKKMDLPEYARGKVQ
jgi:hypothetical protein